MKESNKKDNSKHMFLQVIRNAHLNHLEVKLLVQGAHRELPSKTTIPLK